MADLALDPAKAMPLPFERSPGYWETVGRRLLRDPAALVAAAMIGVLLLLVAFGPFFAPADPYAASMLNRLKPIGFECHPLGTDELGRDMLSRLIVGARGAGDTDGPPGCSDLRTSGTEHVPGSHPARGWHVQRAQSRRPGSGPGCEGRQWRRSLHRD